MRRQYTATVTQRGQVTIPAEVRRQLGLERGDKVIFAVEDGRVSLHRPALTLDQVFGSVPALPGTTTEDFEAQIEAAKEEIAERTVRELRGR